MSKNSDKIKKLKTALKNSPSDIKVLSSLVEIYLRCGDTKNALKQVDEFTKRFTDTDVQVRFLWGRVYETTKQVELAERYYKQVFDWYEQNLDSRSVDAYIHLGNYWRGKDDARSFRCYYQAYNLGCVDAKVEEQISTILSVFVDVFNQQWFIVYQQNNLFAYSTRQIVSFPSVQLHPTDSSVWGQQIGDFLSQSQWGIDLDFFASPIFSRQVTDNIFCDRIVLARLSRRFSCSQEELMIHRVAYRMMQCVVESLEKGVQNALPSFIRDWLSWEHDPLSLTFSARLWHKLFHSGWFQSESEHDGLSRIFARYRDVLSLLPSSLNLARTHLVWYGLGYAISSYEAWNSALFHKLVVPSIHLALEQRNYFYADRLGSQTDFSYAQQPMTEEQQLLCRNAYVNETRQAGKLVADTLPKLSLSKEQQPVRIAFVVNLVFNDAAPIKVLFDILQKVSQMSPVPLVAKIYAFYGFSENNPAEKQYLINRFQSVGVEIIDVTIRRGKHFNDDDYLQRLLFLRKLMQQDEVSVALYLQCSSFFIIFASAVKLAPIQVFFSMAAEGTFRLPELNGYLAGSLFENKIMLHGYEWRAVVGAVGADTIYSKTPEQDLQRAKQIRSQFPADAVLFGSMGRTQKIDNDMFLDIVAEILYHHPQTIFLWFGKEELASVKEKMQVRGILERCLFQGWVNIHEYIHVLDIHLDSYPFGTGVTMFASMAVGVPAVFFHQENTEQDKEHTILSIGDIAIYPAWAGISGTLEQQNRVRAIFTDENGENLFLHAITPHEYVAYAHRLIKDKTFHRKVGKACQEYMMFMGEFSSKKAGESFVQHIYEIMEEYQTRQDT